MKPKAERILPTSFLKELRSIIREHNKDAANGKDKRVGHLTQEKRQGVLENGFADLFELNIKLGTPRNFKAKHMETLAKHWESKGQSASTIQNKICIFRIFVNVWLNKPNVILDSKDYVSNPDSVHRQYSALADKSWEGNGIDVEAKLQEIYALDRYIGLQARLEDAFGLRGREAIEFRPHVDDRGDHIEIFRGTKGGRSRIGWVRNKYQRDVLEACKQLVRHKNSDMRHPGHDIEQALNRYQYIMRKVGITRSELGVTPHGLRTGFANRRYQHYAGARSPVQGGLVGQVDRETDAMARLRTSEELGHSRICVTTAYYGSHGHKMRNAPKRKSESPEKPINAEAITREDANVLLDQKSDKPRLDWSGGGQVITADVKLKLEQKNQPGDEEEENAA